MFPAAQANLHRAPDSLTPLPVQLRAPPSAESGYKTVPHRIHCLCHAVIKDFGKYIGADNKQVQGLIRTAKKNGERLGFLA